MTALAAKDLQKSFNKRQVVNNVSLEVNTGEVVGLLGPNGAGKTTTFYMIVGLIKADAGDIILNGQNVASIPMHGRAQLGIGYLAQEPSIFRKLSVADNILAVLELKPKLNKSARSHRLDELLHDFHISHLRNNLALGLSGGERRRVEIARALAADPSYILLDEPFAGVDPISVIDIQRIIQELKERNIGVLITDHNVRETLGSCDRAYIINSGEVIAEGTSEDILQHDEVREVYLGHEFKM